MLAKTVNRSKSLIPKYVRAYVGHFLDPDADETERRRRFENKSQYNDDGRSPSPFDKAKIIPNLSENRVMRRVNYAHNWDFEGQNPRDVMDECYFQEADPEDPFDEHPLPFYMEFQILFFAHTQSYFNTLRRSQKLGLGNFPLP